MFEIASAKTTYQFPEDPWGLLIVREFYECGGFSKHECLQQTHNKFTELFESKFEPDDPWSLRCRALAVWAYICLELELGQTEIELPVIAIAAALEGLPRSEHPDWLVQLGFDLLQYKHAGESDEANLGWIEGALNETCQLAWPNFENTRFEGDPRATHLSNTIRLLKRLATTEKIAGASLILCNVVGQSKHRSDVEFWLKNARSGESPVKELATFYFGCWKESRNPGSGLVDLQSLSFPLDDDPYYPILAGIASSAKAARLSTEGAALSEADNINPLFSDSNFESVCAIDPMVVDQFAVLSRTMKRLSSLLETQITNEVSIISSTTSHLESCDIRDCVRYLSLETGRLIEATLKQGLIIWFSDDKDLCRNDPLRQNQWDYLHYCNFIGKIFGDGENILGIHELFEKARIKVPREDFFKIYPVRERRGKVTLLNKATNVFSLIIANFLAAKCNDSHPFRLFAVDDLVKFLDSFNVAYSDRNLSAHFSISSTTTPVDVLRRARDVQNLATRFLRQVNV